MGKIGRWWRNWIGHMEVQSGRNWNEDENAWIVDVVLEAGRKRTPELLPGLIWALGADNRKIAWASAAQIERILGACPPEALLELDESGRHMALVGMPWTHNYSSHAKTLKRRMRLPGAPLGLWLAGTIHNDGHFRQSSLRKLRPGTGRSGLAFVLLRLDDWVPDVRKRAEFALAPYLKNWELHANHFTELLPLILRLARRQRAGGSPALTSVLRNIAAAPSDLEVAALLLRLENIQPSPLRVDLCSFLFSVRENLTANRSEQLLRACMTSSHIGLIQTAYRTTLDRGTEAEKDAIGLQLWRSAQPASRRMGFELLVLRLNHSGARRDLIEEALVDPSARVRELARYYATSVIGRTREEHAELYRELLLDPKSSSKQRTIGATELGQVGFNSDTPLLHKTVLHESCGALRAAALTSLAKLNGEEYREFFVQQLASPSSRVSRVALRALQAQAKHRVLMAPAELDDLTSKRHPAHVRRNALRLAQDLGKWDGLAAILAALSGPDPIDASIVETALWTWLEHANRSFITPRKDQWLAAQARLEEVTMRLPEQLSTELASILRSMAHFGI